MFLRFKLGKAHDGSQIVLSLNRFDISIVSHIYSYGGKQGLYELGVFWTDEPVYYDIDEDSREFVNDVKGWLDEESVTNIVDRLSSLDESSDRLVYNILEILQ